MIVSHRHRFIFFPDPAGGSARIETALRPWADQAICDTRLGTRHNTLFHGMSPAEAELAFDMMDLPFRKYTRVAVVRDPYAKMAYLYHRIAAIDPVWRVRRRLGLTIPDYQEWLRKTRPNGPGAGYRSGPRWRRFGAWSGNAWCGNHISHVVRAEAVEIDLCPILKDLGITPVFGPHLRTTWRQSSNHFRDHPDVGNVINNRYAWDLAFYGRADQALRLAA